MVSRQGKALNNLHGLLLGQAFCQGEIEARESSPPHCPKEGNQQQENQERRDGLAEGFQVKFLRPIRRGRTEPMKQLG